MSRMFEQIDGELVYFCNRSLYLLCWAGTCTPCHVENDEQKRSADQALAPPCPSSSDVPGRGHTVASRGAVGTPAGSTQAQGWWETKGAPQFLTPRMFASRQHSTCSPAFSVLPKDRPSLSPRTEQARACRGWFPGVPQARAVETCGVSGVHPLVPLMLCCRRGIGDLQCDGRDKGVQRPRRI